MTNQPPHDPREHPEHEATEPGHHHRAPHSHEYHRGGHADLGATETIQLRTPDHVVIAVPYLIGFVPADSIVVLVLTGGRIQATVRVDLPSPADAAPLATHLTTTFARARVAPEQVVLVGYGPADITPALSRFADALPWPVTGLLRVEGDRWWSLTCPDPQCCPPGATVEPDETITAPLLAASGHPAASRQARAADLAAGPRSVRNDVSAALVATPGRDLPPAQLLGRLAAAHAARSDHRLPLTSAEAAVLLHGLRHLQVRDACTAWVDQAALNLWGDLLVVAPEAFVAPPATLLALTAYQLGDGALASMAALRALDAEPGYRLAVMTLQLIRLTLPPREVIALLQDAARENALTPDPPPPA